jgi:crotonobetainyl-CoA:carnitine CoA-transferase CaiB-like acyl-CoA transferase
MLKIFDGLRVAEFSQGMAGPLAGMVLADNGADVIKVEPPGGDWGRRLTGFGMWNRGKRSVELDLNDARSARRAHDLVRDADVIMESFNPDDACRFGLNSAATAITNPRVIHCNISGFGTVGGRYGRLTPYEGIVAARSGRMMGADSLSGAAIPNAASRPVFQASPTGSYGAAMLAVQGIVAALYQSDSTGRPAVVETSLLDGALAATMRLPFKRIGSEVVPVREGRDNLQHAGVQLTFLTAECSDGRFIQMCARQDHHFRNWLRALDLDYLLSEPRFAAAPLGIRSFDDIHEMESMIRARMKGKTQDEWMTLFVERYDVGADPFLHPSEFLRHPQMVENGRVVHVKGDARPQPGPLAVFEATPSVVERPAPSLAEHQGTSWRGTGFRHPASDLEPAATDTREGPLAGVTVLEFAYFVAGPLGATLLADLGARVIKIEPIEGDPFRRVGLEFVHLVKGKESIAVDLKADAGRKILYDLVREADALLHSFRPGVPERLGMDYETLRNLNPGLVYLYAGSYGSKGPQSHRAAFHSTPNALCGAGIIQAGAGNPPADNSWPDPCAGLGVATALAMGLLAKKRFGVGQYIETTMLASASYVHSNDMLAEPYAERIADPGQQGLHPLYRLYRCRSGWIFLAAIRDREWSNLAHALGHAEWVVEGYSTPEAREASSSSLAHELEEIFMTNTAAAWEDRLVVAGVPVAIADDTTFEEFLVTEGLLRAGFHDGFGEYFSMPPRVRVNSFVPNRPPSACGEFTNRLLAELGYSAERLEGLAAQGVIRDAAGDSTSAPARPLR